MLPVTNRLGLRIKMKRTASGLTRKGITIYLGGKLSPRTIFNVEMGSPHAQTQETLRRLLWGAFPKLNPQVITLRVRIRGLGHQAGRVKRMLLIVFGAVKAYGSKLSPNSRRRPWQPVTRRINLSNRRS